MGLGIKSSEHGCFRLNPAPLFLLLSLTESPGGNTGSRD